MNPTLATSSPTSAATRDAEHQHGGIEALTPAALIHLASAAIEAGDLDAARGHMEAAIRALHERADLHCDLGHICLAQGDTAAAIRSFLAALAVDTGFVPAHLAMADLHAGAGRSKDALLHLRALLAIDDKQLDAWTRIADLMDATGQAGEAASVREKILILARQAVLDALARIKGDSGSTPIYEMDSNRRSHSTAMEYFADTAIKVAHHHIAEAARDEAYRTFIEALQFLAQVSKQAEDIDGLRRTFVTTANAYVRCRYELALMREAEGNIAGAIFELEEVVRASHGPFPEGWQRLGELVGRHGGSIADIRDAVEAYAGKPVPPAAAPITRLDLVRHARRWFERVTATRRQLADGARRQILLTAFNVHHIQTILPLACVLLARGHDVDFVWLPATRHERACTPEPNYDYWDEVLLTNELKHLAESSLPDGLRLLDLRDFPLAAELDDMAPLCRQLAANDACNISRSMNIAGDSAIQTLIETRFQLDMDGMRRLASCMDSQTYDLAVIFGGVFLEYGAAFHEARRRDINVVAFEDSPFSRHDFLISNNRTHADLDRAAVWRTDEPHVLDEARKRRVIEWLASRDDGDYREPKPRGRIGRWPDRSTAALKPLGLDPKKPVVALFPNLTWDGTALGREVAFDSLRDWVLSTIEFFIAKPEFQLVVRIHPLEAEYSNDHVGKIIRDRWPDLPAHIHIVETGDPLSSYRLLDVIQLGLVYTTTVGLEMHLRGVPCICAARAVYGGLGFTRDAQSREHYFGMIDQILADPGGMQCSQRDIELAWCFADLIMNKTGRPYPWHYTDPWGSILGDWPMERVLSPDGEAAFGETFAILAGEIDLPDGIVGDVETMRQD